MQLYSMTGFAMGEAQLSPRVSAQIMIRSVNHRYRDIQLRFIGRDEGPELESRLRRQLENFVQRGRVSAQVELRWLEAPDSRILLDPSVIEALLEQLGRLGEVRLGEVLGIPGLVTVSTTAHTLTTEEGKELDRLLREVGKIFRNRRAEEAEALLVQIRRELEKLDAFVAWIEPRLPEFRQGVLERLRERLQVLMEDSAPEETRLLQEAAMLADRAEVSEEVVRLKTHLAHFRQRITAGGTVGRSLDFLCQELHREINTLGTKCRESGVAGQVVDAKTAIEKIREQVQNLE